MSAPIEPLGLGLIADYASVDGNHQPDIEKALAFGIRGAYVRAGYTYGPYAHPDSTAARDAAAWRTGGKFGAYMILGWTCPVKDQVDNFCRAYTMHPLDMPVALDLEADSADSIGMKPDQALYLAEQAWMALKKAYGAVMIYTSTRVWYDVFGDALSGMGDSALWLKVPYAWRARNQPHLETAEPMKIIEKPRPWTPANRGALQLKQFQGDAINVPGFSSTVDLSVLPPTSTLLNSGTLPQTIPSVM